MGYCASPLNALFTQDAKRPQKMERVAVNRSVHTAHKRHQRTAVICTQMCFRLLCELRLTTRGHFATQNMVSDFCPLARKPVFTRKARMPTSNYLFLAALSISTTDVRTWTYLVTPGVFPTLQTLLLFRLFITLLFPVLGKPAKHEHRDKSTTNTGTLRKGRAPSTVT